MKKIILFFFLLFSSCFCFSQNNQNYQWHGFDPGIFCLDSPLATPCQILNFEVDTQRDVLWIFGDFGGAGTTISHYIVAYQNNQFLSFPGLGQSLAHANDYVFYNNKLIGCSFGAVWSYNLASQQITIIGLLGNSGTIWGGLCLAVYRGDLYLAGGFSAVKESTGGWVSGTTGIARWDGQQWHSVGGGIIGSPVHVNKLIVFRDKLIAGGYFETAGGVSAWGIAQWNDTTWNNLWTGDGSHGVTVEPPSNYNHAEVKDMTIFDDDLYIVGRYDSVCGVKSHLASWNDTSWTGHPFVNNSNSNIVSFEDKLIINGFDLWGVGVSQPEFMNGSIVGSGFSPSNSVKCLVNFHDTIYAAGYFSSSGATLIFQLARLLYDSTSTKIKNIWGENGLDMYPNPATNQLTIVSKQLTINAIEIKDLTGRIFYSAQTNSQLSIINCQLFPAGVYFIKVHLTDVSETVRKFVKE